MREGWHENTYLILFDEGEVPLASERYGIASMLPGFQILGLRGWDDFIVRDGSGALFTVPTIPCDAKHLTPHHPDAASPTLLSDAQVTGRIKWYVKPIAICGEPSAGPNLAWVTHDKHAQLVRWWNDQLRTHSAKVDKG